MIQAMNNEIKEILEKMTIRKERIKRVNGLYKNFEKRLSSGIIKSGHKEKNMKKKIACLQKASEK